MMKETANQYQTLLLIVIGLAVCLALFAASQAGQLTLSDDHPTVTFFCSLVTLFSLASWWELRRQHHALKKILYTD